MNPCRGISRLVLVGLVVAICGFACASASAAWTVVSTSVPVGTTESRLFDVSCQGEKPCWAVGEYRNSSGVLAPIAWNAVTGAYALPTSPGTHPQLTAVSCPQTSSNNLCMAAGRFVNNSGALQAFAEKYTGTTWELQSLPFPAGSTSSEIGSISCATESECVAVGDYHNATGIHYLAERWAGGIWTAETPAEPAGIGFQALTGLSCPAAGECVSVGEYRVSPYGLSTQRLETERFSSTPTLTWSYQGTPFFAPGSGTVPALGSISCFASSECFGAGYYTNTTPALEMMTWKGVTPPPGSGWTQQSMTALSGQTELNGVSCRTASICVAVGKRAVSGVGSALAEELLLGSWSQITLPTVSGAAETNLNRDFCMARSGVNFCLAVGWSVSSGGVTSMLVERNF
jgi:hypothetical protein